MESSIEKIIIRYLERKATSTEKQELLSWLQESKEHERMFLVYYDIWSMSQQLAFDPRAALKKVITPTPNHHRRILYWSLSAAACIAIFFGINRIWDMNRTQAPNIRYVAQQTNSDTERADSEDIRLILSDDKQVTVENRKETTISYLNTEIEIDEEQTVPKNEAAAFNQLITPHGKRGTLVLEDGTKIWLNAGSRLIYPAQFGKENREVYVDGEIYLEVTPDKERPFIVKTDRINVQVMGTSLAISAYKNAKQSHVILASGSVNVYAEHNKKGKYRLSPNEIYQLSENGQAKVEHVADVTQYTSWIHGIYQFEHESLASILSLMERFYGQKIECVPEAGKLTCSGKLRLNDDFINTLHGLAETLPISIENRNNFFYINNMNK